MKQLVDTVIIIRGWLAWEWRAEKGNAVLQPNIPVERP